MAGLWPPSPSFSEPESGSGWRFAQAESAAYKSCVGGCDSGCKSSAAAECWVEVLGAGEGVIVREIVESGSWSSNVWAAVRSWRKRLAG